MVLITLEHLLVIYNKVQASCEYESRIPMWYLPENKKYQIYANYIACCRNYHNGEIIYLQKRMISVFLVVQKHRHIGSTPKMADKRVRERLIPWFQTSKEKCLVKQNYQYLDYSKLAISFAHQVLKNLCNKWRVQSQLYMSCIEGWCYTQRFSTTIRNKTP